MEKMFSSTKLKRARAQNYTAAEVDLILNLVEKYLDTIECKRTDHLTNSLKEKVWEEISFKYNLMSSTKRTQEMLKLKWESLKKVSRKQYNLIQERLREAEYDNGTHVLGYTANRVLNVLAKHEGQNNDNLSNSIFLKDANFEEQELTSTFSEDNNSLIHKEDIKIEMPEWSMSSSDGLKEIPQNNETEQPIADVPAPTTYEDPLKKRKKDDDQINFSLRRNPPESSKKLETRIEERKLQLLSAQLEMYIKEAEIRLKQSQERHQYEMQEFQQKIIQTREKHELEIQDMKLQLEIKKRQLANM